MNLPCEVRMFRSPRWAVAAAMVSAVLFLAVAYLSYRFNGLSWVTVTLLVLVPIGIAGAADALTQRIELHPEHIVVVRNLRRREYPRSMFVKAQWGKGRSRVTSVHQRRVDSASGRRINRSGSRQHVTRVAQSVKATRYQFREISNDTTPASSSPLIPKADRASQDCRSECHARPPSSVPVRSSMRAQPSRKPTALKPVKSSRNVMILRRTRRNNTSRPAVATRARMARTRPRARFTRQCYV